MLRDGDMLDGEALNINERDGKWHDDDTLDGYSDTLDEDGDNLDVNKNDSKWIDGNALGMDGSHGDKLDGDGLINIICQWRRRWRGRVQEGQCRRTGRAQALGAWCRTNGATRSCSYLTITTTWWSLAC